MDFQNQVSQNNTPVSARPVGISDNAMSRASLILAVCGIFSTFLLPFYLPCVFTGLSILFALLSKGYEKKMTSAAKGGLITSVCVLIFNLFFLILVVFLIVTVPEYREQFNSAYEQIYGESFQGFDN